jgi:hypothetical protein
VCTRQRCQVGVQPLGHGGLQPLMRIGDHQLDAPQATPGEAAQELGPEGLGFRGAHRHAQDLDLPQCACCALVFLGKDDQIAEDTVFIEKGRCWSLSGILCEGSY